MNVFIRHRPASNSLLGAIRISCDQKKDGAKTSPSSMYMYIHIHRRTEAYHCVVICKAVGARPLAHQPTARPHITSTSQQASSQLAS